MKVNSIKGTSGYRTTQRKIQTNPGYQKMGRAVGVAKNQVHYKKVAGVTQPKAKQYKVLTRHTFSRERAKGSIVNEHYLDAQRNGRMLSLKHEHYMSKGKTTIGPYTHTANVNLKHVGIGTAAAVGGYEAYHHRAQIKQKVQNVGSHVSDAFHASRLHHGNVA